MSVLAYVLVFSVISGVLSLAGGVLLLASERLANMLSRPLSAFAAGALIATALVDVIPEAIARANATAVLRATLLGFLSFLILETFIRRSHHQRHHDQGVAVPLIIIGDTVHNFMDGMVIAATFLADIRLGIIASFAVAAHEVPQEIGDFAVLLRSGMGRRRVLLINVLSALATLAGAAITFAVGESEQVMLPAVLAASGGFFLYLAASNLIPQMHHAEGGTPLLDTALLVAGAAIVVAMTA